VVELSDIFINVLFIVTGSGFMMPDFFLILMCNLVHFDEFWQRIIN